MYNNYLDLEEENGHLVHVLPIPYEGTVSFTTGTKDGPEAILKASYEIETWDLEYGYDLADMAHFKTAPAFRPPVSGPEEMYKKLLGYLQDKYSPGEDLLLTLGGEHSIALGPIEFYQSMNRDLVVLQLDAHADLRDEFQYSRYSHACVMARTRELGIPLVQVGIRSLSKEEHQFLENTPDSEIFTLFASSLPEPQIAAQKVLEVLAGRSLYISFDADALDPSILPGTGTPEPGGIFYEWLNRFFYLLLPRIRLVGLDFCELKPLSNGEVVSESVAVKCINKILTAYLSGSI